MSTEEIFFRYMELSEKYRINIHKLQNHFIKNLNNPVIVNHFDKGRS